MLIPTAFLDRLGNWNPQLLREWKGRLKRIPITLAVVLSLVLQLGIVFCFTLALPGSVEFQDLHLATSPQLTLSSGVDGNQQPFLTLTDVQPVEIARGNPLSQEEQLARIPPGSSHRLLQIDGQPLPTLPADWSRDNDPSAYFLQDWANQRLFLNSNSYGQPSLEELSIRARIGQTITVSLQLANGSKHTAALDLVGMTSKQNPFCIPSFYVSESYPYTRCALSDDRQSYQVRWDRWYFWLFVTLSGVMFLVLGALGSFMIFNDLDQEQKRGTLNFVRLSPRSSLSILAGKWLGVPAALYLGVLLAIPLHLYTGLGAGFHPIALLCFYLTLVVQLLLFYSIGSLACISNFGLVNFQPWLYTSLGVCFWGGANLLMTTYTINIGSPSPSFSVLWFGLFAPAMPLLYGCQALSFGPSDWTGVGFILGGHPLELEGYMVAMLLNAAFWLTIIYLGIDRKFHNPGATTIPRQYSYVITIVFSISLLIFAIPNDRVLNWTNTNDSENWLLGNFSLILGLTSLALIGLTHALTPQRQTIMDWLKFKGKTPVHPEDEPLNLALALEKPSSSHTQTWWYRWFALDNSPALPALILNLFLVMSCIVLWLLGTTQVIGMDDKPETLSWTLGTIVLLTGLALIVLCLTQIIELTGFKRPQVWAAWAMIATLITHPLVMSLSYWYLAIPRRTLPLGFRPETWMVFGTAVGQWLVIMGLLAFHGRQLRLASRSDLQELLTSKR